MACFLCDIDCGVADGTNYRGKCFGRRCYLLVRKIHRLKPSKSRVQIAPYVAPHRRRWEDQVGDFITFLVDFFFHGRFGSLFVFPR